MNTQVIDTPEYESGRETGAFQDERKSGLLAKVKGLYEGYREWARYRAAIRELSLMDDARLADIGIVRGEIRTVVRQAMNDNKRRDRRSVELSG